MQATGIAPGLLGAVIGHCQQPVAFYLSLGVEGDSPVSLVGVGKVGRAQVLHVAFQVVGSHRAFGEADQDPVACMRLHIGAYINLDVVQFEFRVVAATGGNRVKPDYAV